ncbi:hypothetical protein [Ignicoccus hospitalis]|uniref:Uncharacterized protein n=1 Tax=Ignicoccus hospitalis (strain KIN4/I / DSM 18386 / JCM 14125) TaxID=453591 RepID=A8ABU7_IGNH4|nr:hypothetical protein [Ignicoccus hospitalis]ABU82399.1 hypothetical protein Igni_1223 [Ignicoccus hospitalis KIN4/I]HIH90874.1 hypothetical protein [Desulfurococcaceae archaeon]
MADRAAELLESVERECKAISKSEEEYRRCLQEKLKELLSSEEAKAIAREALEEE